MHQHEQPSARVGAHDESLHDDVIGQSETLGGVSCATTLLVVVGVSRELDATLFEQAGRRRFAVRCCGHHQRRPRGEVPLLSDVVRRLLVYTADHGAQGTG